MTETAERAVKCMLAMQRYPWEQGVCAQALYEAGRDDLFIPMAYDAVKRQSADGRLAMLGGGSAVSDPASNGEVCLRAYERTGDETLLNAARRMLGYLKNAAPRTPDGIICHNLKTHHEGFSPFQLWIDGMYMVPPFLACMGETDWASEQIRGYIRHLYDKESGVFFHIVDCLDERFVRRKRWATGNGWALMGLVRVIDAARKQGNTCVQEELTAFLNRLLKAVMRYQMPDGRFHDILDDETSFADGASAMMAAAAIYRGIYTGCVPRAFEPAAERAYRTVQNKVDAAGFVREVCGCPDFQSEGTSAEAQAAFVMADAWREKLQAPAV